MVLQRSDGETRVVALRLGLRYGGGLTRTIMGQQGLARIGVCTHTHASHQGGVFGESVTGS